MNFFDDIAEIEALQDEIDKEDGQNFKYVIEEVSNILTKYIISSASVLLGLLIIVMR